MSEPPKVDEPRRWRSRTLAFALAIPGAVALAVALLAFGLVSPFGARTAIPPCEELPLMTEVIEALEERASFVEELLAVGPDVRVRPEDPCGDGRLRGVVSVQYRTAEQREAIHELFNRSDGLGVPAQVIR